MITPNAGLPLPKVNPRAISTSTRQRVQTVQHHNSSRFPAYSRGKKRLFLAYFILIIFFYIFIKKYLNCWGLYYCVKILKVRSRQRIIFQCKIRLKSISCNEVGRIGCNRFIRDVNVRSQCKFYIVFNLLCCVLIRNVIVY
jgi:hypothetical protein